MQSLDNYEDRWIAIKIFLTVFLISAFFFRPDLTFPRFEFLTKALVHYGTTWVDKVQQLSGILCWDTFKLNNHSYLVPTPGLSFIALASYLPYAALLQSRLIQIFSLDPVLEFKLSQFIIALSTVTLFTALLIAIFFLSLRKIGCTQKKAVIFSFLLYFGTPVIYYSLNVSNGQNILETSILFIAFFILLGVFRPEGTPAGSIMNISEAQARGLVFLSGLLCGLAVFVNVTALFFLPFFVFILLSAKRWKNLLFWIPGTILGLAPLFIYNQVSFGSFLKSSYRATYGNLISFHAGSCLDIVKTLLISPKIGLVFFFPFVIMLAPMFRKLFSNLTGRFILLCALFYTACLGFILPPMFELDRIISTWYRGQGGGGPRYLLPVIPFLFYAIAGSKFESQRQRFIASALIFISVIINAPGLFWSGGQAVFYNNLILFLKNGFHSSMIDLIRDILASGGFNASGLSMFPLLLILGIFIWWIWAGERWIRDAL